MYSNKKIIIADLDGTLSRSKTQMDSEMSGILAELLKYKDFAVISGGSYAQFQKQFIGGLACPPERLARLYLFPTCATSLYRFANGKWSPAYSESLSADEKTRIKLFFTTALRKAGFQKPEKVYGELIEDRGTQITFSAFGGDAPLELKHVWDPDRKRRMAIRGFLMELLPEFEITIGGTTSIDVTRKGIDKRYGIRKIKELLGYSYGQMFFLGDAIVEGGNDYPVKQEGIEYVNVSGPEETKLILRAIIRESE